MLFRRLFLASLVVAAVPGMPLAESFLEDVATNPAVQALGSSVTYQMKNFAPTVPLTTTNTALSPPMAPTPGPMSGAVPPDPFHAALAAPTQTAAPVIYQGVPKAPPPGYTGGTVCQNGTCQLAPVQVPAVQPQTATATPQYPPGFAGNTFPQPTSAQPPRGVKVEVEPVGRTSDLSKVREGVLNVLPPKP